MGLEGIDVDAFVQALSIPTQEALAALPQIQKQPEAWQLAFDLLATNNDTCQFFGAHTLHAKVTRDLDTLDTDRREALRHELVRVAVESSKGAANVLSKLCQALAAYLLAQPTEGCLLGAAMSAIQERAQSTGNDAAYAIVEFLGVFAEELNTTALATAEQARIVQDVRDALPQALQVLLGVVSGLEGSPATDAPEFARRAGQQVSWRVRAWRGLQQWLQFGVPGDTLFVPLLEAVLAQLRVLAAYQLRGDGDEDEIAAATTAADDMVGNAAIAARFGRSVSETVLAHFAQPWLAQVVEHSDSEGVLPWAAMIVTFGETYTEHIAAHLDEDHVVAYLRLAVALTQFPGHAGLDEEVSVQPLGLWCLLQEALADSETSSTFAHSAYADVVRALLAKCAYPPTEVWTAADRDAREQFTAYRREAGDALLGAFYVLRGDMLCALVDSALAASDWRYAEAALFALRSVGEAVPQDENDHLPRLFAPGALMQLQPGLTTLHAAVLSLAGAYAEWLSARPALLADVVPRVAAALNEPALVPAAVTALRRLCDNCRTQLGDAVPGLVQLARDSLQTLPSREQQRVLEAVADVILAQSPSTHAAALAPLTASLLPALQAAVARLTPDPDSQTGLIDCLRGIEALARGLQFADDIEERALAGNAEAISMLAFAAQCYCDESLAAFRAGMLSTLNRVLAAPESLNDELLEAMLAAVGAYVRRGPHAFAPDFGQVISFVRCTWEACVARAGSDGAPAISARWADLCPPLLQSMAQLATVAAPKPWRSDTDTDVALGALLARAVGDVCTGLACAAPTLEAAVEQQPVVSERVFDLGSRVLLERLELVVHSEMAAAHLCKLGVHALAVPSRLALRPATSFLGTVVRLGAPSARASSASPLLQALCSEFAPAWLRATLAGIGGALPRSLLPGLSELLFALVRHHLQPARAWIAELLRDPSFPSPHASERAKRQFTQQLLATRSFVRAKAIISEFAIQCRNLQGTSYAS
ncbi:hypothetical protein LPJ68_001403 [Coemansia sp. RSA 1086]|nr:hypothetical protein LPJ68_001403 [Coemansia sp. RSA 1086]